MIVNDRELLFLDVRDLHPQVWLTMAGLSAITLAPTILDDGHLLAANLIHHVGSDGRTSDVRRADRRSAVFAADSQHTIERDGLARIFARVEVQHVAGLHFDLTTAVFNDRVHGWNSCLGLKRAGQYSMA